MGVIIRSAIGTVKIAFVMVTSYVGAGQAVNMTVNSAGGWLGKHWAELSDPGKNMCICLRRFELLLFNVCG